MAKWSDLKTAIAQIIKTNGNQEITGQLLQNVLFSIVNSVGENSTFAGIATPATNPGTPDGNVFYLATEAGIYANFNGIEITAKEAVVLEWKGSWSKRIIGFAMQYQLSELEKKFGQVVEENFSTYPNAAWHFRKILKDGEKGFIKIKTDAEIKSGGSRVYNGSLDFNFSITKDWQYIDLAGCESFQVYTNLSENAEITLSFISESELLNFVNDKLKETNAKVSELYLQKDLPKENSKKIENLEDEITCINDNIISKRIEITEPKSWESQKSYANNRPFSFSLLDIINSGVRPTDINILFNSENRTIPSIVLEYGSTNGGNSTKTKAPILLKNEGNKYYYQYLLPDFSELRIDGKLTKYTVTCQISGEATSETPHRVNLTEVTYNEYLSQAIDELEKKFGQVVEENFSTYPNAAWHFRKILKDGEKGFIKIKTDAEIKSGGSRVYNGSLDFNFSITKDWQYIDLAGCESFQVYTNLSENAEITLSFISESELLNFVNDKLKETNAKVSELYLQKDLPKENSKKIENLEDEITCINDNIISKRIEITEPKSWESQKSYANNRPFSFSLLDIINSGVRPTDINILFNSENRTIPSIVLEYGSTNGGNSTKTKAPILLKNEGNKYYYQYLLPDFSELRIDGKLTKYTVTCQISGEATPETPHRVNLTEATYNEYPSQVIDELDKRVTILENENDSGKTAAIDYEWRGYHSMIHVSVKKDGSGDFTTIQDAINSITDASPIKQYDVQVYDDFEITDLKDLYVSTGEKNTSDNPTKEVAFIWTKNWVHIRGMKGHGNRLYIESPSDIASTTFQYVQVIKAQGNCIINNFYVGIKGGRYAIHQESGGSKTHIDYHAHTIYKNLIIEHKGNDGYTNGSGWTSTMAQANGTTSGLKQTYINCKWISANTTPFYTHTNSEFDEPNEQTMINCSIVCTSKNIKIPSMGQYWGDIGSGQKAVLKFIGCNIANFKKAAGYGETRGNEKTNNVRAKYGYNGGAELQGYGNTPMAIVQASKPCLTFNSVDNNKQIDVVGGTAYELLWEKTWEKIKGTAVNQGFCVGSIRLSQTESRLGNSQVFCLPYILGNCASSPKTLIVKVDEQEYTITFNKNYMTADGGSYSWNTEPAVNNSQVIADINEVQPTIFQASFNSPIQELYTFEDCQELGINASTSVISAGKCLKRSPTGYQMWEIAQDGDMVEGVAGNWMTPIDYADGDNVFGRVLIPKKSYFPVSLFELPPTRVGTMYKAANDGKLAITKDKSEASFITVDINCLIGI